jgi:hypothetical protein
MPPEPQLSEGWPNPFPSRSQADDATNNLERILVGWVSLAVHDGRYIATPELNDQKPSSGILSAF